MTVALPTVFTLATGHFSSPWSVSTRDANCPTRPAGYGRAIAINLCQVAITLATNKLWIAAFSGASAFHLPSLDMPVVETPELHSIHHQLDVHKYNFADLPMWDRLFGTYKDTNDFMPQCGFPRHNERRLWQMLLFRDVYND